MSKSKQKSPTHTAEAARQLRKFANACRVDGHTDECSRIDAAAYLLDPTADVEELDGVESAEEVAEPTPTKPKRNAKAAETAPRAPAREQLVEAEYEVDDDPVEEAPAPTTRKKKPARE